MLPPALGGLRIRVPPVPCRHAPGSMGKIKLSCGHPQDTIIIPHRALKWQARDFEIFRDNATDGSKEIFESVGIAPSAQTPLILLMNRSCKFAILPYFFGIYVNIIRPTKCTAFCSHLSKKRRIAQSPPVVILEIRRAVEDSDCTVFKRHPDMPIVNRLSLYDLMQNIHADRQPAQPLRLDAKHSCEYSLLGAWKRSSCHAVTRKTIKLYYIRPFAVK